MVSGRIPAGRRRAHDASPAATLEVGLGADTTHGEAHFLLGVAHQQLGNLDRLHALAQAYEAVGRDPAVIDRLYQRALRLQPALADVRVDYGPFLQAQGRTEEALAAYEAALAEQPWNALAALKTRNGVLLRTLEKPDASPALAWDLRTEAGSFIPSGLYLIHIRAFNNTGRPQETTVLRWAAVRHHTP